MRKNKSSGLCRGVVESYALSCSHKNIRPGDFPAIRHVKRADAVIENRYALGGDAIFLFGVVYVDMIDELRHHAYSMEQESGYYPGGTSAGSPYLFIENDNGMPQLLGVKFTKDVLAEGGFSKIGQIVMDENKNMDFSKHSTDSTVFQAMEIGAAIKVAENYYLEETSESILPINTWFDENRYQTDVMDCLENPLYGMDEAAERNDLLILYSDLYFLDSDSGRLPRNWKTIMIRESTNSPWRVVDTGY